jgi:hypothetical protein
MIKEPMKLGTIPASAGGLLTIDAFAADSLERRDLRGGFLIGG